MMHEPEKSDSAVVAMKSTNNAEQSAAESVERRAGTKGNVGQQSTRRAQDRESVSQALERMGEAAGDQGRATPTHTAAHPRAREMAEAGHHWLLCLPRGADQLSVAWCVP